MSKDLTTARTLSLNIDDVKSELVSGAHPTMPTTRSIAKLRRDFYALAPTVESQKARFAEYGYDVERTLARCEAFLAIASALTASQTQALDEQKGATKARDEAFRSLIAAKEALIALARTSGASTTPYEIAFTKPGQDAIGAGESLLAALGLTGHLLRYPLLVEKVRAQIAESTRALANAERAQDARRRSRKSTTQEKQLARGALVHAIVELSRLGRVIFADDREMKSAFSLEMFASKRGKRGAIVEGGTDGVVDEVNDEVDSPEVVVAPAVEVAIVN